ncbi:MAG: FtsH protease activity modulator HflK [Clostridia bacterium]|jgi:membrane protease subunit HflK|nr:FtsH protease activity modulator HflK [Clostridia bacterium]
MLKKDFQTKVNEFFERLKINTMKAIGLIFVFVTVLNSIYILDTGKVGVIFRFDKFLREERKSGINFKVPYIDKVVKVNVEKSYKIEYGYETIKEGTEYSSPVYRDHFDEATMIVGAKDNNSSIVLINLMVRYKVDKPVDYLIKVDDLEGTMKIALEDVLRNTMQTHSLSEALTDKALIDSEVLPELQKKMNAYTAGVKITEVKTQNTDLPEQVNSAYQMVEEANQYKNSKLEEAQKYQNMIVPKAEAEAIKNIESAKAYKAEIEAEAKASVAQYEALYGEYIKNKNVTKEKMYIEAMKSFVENNEIVIDGTKTSNIHKFYDIDKNLFKKETSR